MKLAVRILRIVPFACLAVLSLWVAGRSPQGRKPFQFDWTISASEVARVVTKVPHLRATAVLFLLATLAVGSNRLPLAFGLTMLVGVGWELAETTVVGHHARLIDLAPDLIGTLTALVFVVFARWVVRRIGNQEQVTSS
jgi:VanZ family protein